MQHPSLRIQSRESTFWRLEGSEEEITQIYALVCNISAPQTGSNSNSSLELHLCPVVLKQRDDVFSSAGSPHSKMWQPEKSIWKMLLHISRADSLNQLCRNRTFSFVVKSLSCNKIWNLKERSSEFNSSGQMFQMELMTICYRPALNG